MNKQRRNAIMNIIEKAEELKGLIETIQEEEQEYYDNIPENLQESDRAEGSQFAICELEYATDNLDECIGNLENACE